jgi:hypothetical protein
MRTIGQLRVSGNHVTIRRWGHRESNRAQAAKVDDRVRYPYCVDELAACTLHPSDQETKEATSAARGQVSRDRERLSPCAKRIPTPAAREVFFDIQGLTVGDIQRRKSADPWASRAATSRSLVPDPSMVQIAKHTVRR